MKYVEVACFLPGYVIPNRKQAIKSTGDIKGFGTLRFDDQTRIKEKIGGLVKTGKGMISS